MGTHARLHLLIHVARSVNVCPRAAAGIAALRCARALTTLMQGCPHTSAFHMDPHAC